MNLVSCEFERHAEAIRSIYNEAIANSTALYEYQARSEESMLRWFAAKKDGGFPVLGIEQGDVLAGFASYGSFRAFPAYKYTAEHSVYVHRDFRGQGIGEQLLKALIERAEQAGLHCLVGVIDASNLASVSLHRKLGFTVAGRLDQVGFKFNRWLDVVFYQRIFAGPLEPSEA